MFKKIFIIVIVFTAFCVIGIIVLNRVYLPVKIKSLIVKGISDQTHKQVSIKSAQFSLFKGLVLRDIVIYDDKQTFIKAKEVSCVFLIWPFFKKQIIIPNVNIKSAEIFLERNLDNQLNILGLFHQTNQKEKAKQLFSVFVSRINILNSRLNFKDNTLNPIFYQTLDNIDLLVRLSLPGNIKFNLESEIAGRLSTEITCEGLYNIAQRKLISKINIKNFSPKEFQAYFKNHGFIIKDGLADAGIKFNINEDTGIDAVVDSEFKDLKLSRDKLNFKLHSTVGVNLKYNLKNRQWDYNGKINILGLDIKGLKLIDEIQVPSAELKFDTTSLSSERLNINLFGMPIEGKIKVSDYKNPLLYINLKAKQKLGLMKNILESKFNFVSPIEIEGQGSLSLDINTNLNLAQVPEVKGYLDIFAGKLRPKNTAIYLEEINGRFNFTADKLTWKNIDFKYLEVSYKTSGNLNNFSLPEIILDLSSSDLSLQSKFSIDKKIIRITKLLGKYYNCDFLLQGDIDSSDTQNLRGSINGEIDLDLPGLKNLKWFKDRLNKINPLGKAKLAFSFNGSFNDFKSSVIQANLSGEYLSLYGFKADKFSIDFRQSNKIADLTRLYLSLYDGTIEATGKMNLATDSLPFWINANIQNIKIEKLKLDTSVKKEDISGLIQAQAKINGFSSDFSRLSGSGQIIVTEGRLWQLDLFKGMGKLIFITDFTNIVFHEGRCDFSIADKTVFTDNLSLKSSLANIFGSAKIGFDNSIDAVLNVQIAQDVPLNGTFKDIATVVLAQAQKFGVIKIDGTLSQPKYKFKPAVVDIMKSIKDIFLNKE